MSHKSLLSKIEEKYIPEPNSGCWLWIGAVNQKTDGYGFIIKTIRGKSIKIYGHRFLYENYRKAIPENYVIDHICRNTYCVNPWHLEAVSHQVNCYRGKAGILKKRRTHCPKRHPLVGNNLIVDKKGYSHCRECKNLHLINYRKRRSNARLLADAIANDFRQTKTLNGDMEG